MTSRKFVRLKERAEILPRNEFGAEQELDQAWHSEFLKDPSAPEES
jgi:hypothetical protein